MEATAPIQLIEPEAQERSPETTPALVETRPDGLPSAHEMWKICQRAYHRMADAREQRVNYLRKYMSEAATGDGADTPASKRRPINLYARTVDTYMALLCGGKVTNRVLPKRTTVAADALKIEPALDGKWHSLQIEDEIVSMAVMDAMFGTFGIVAWGMKAGSSIVDIDGGQYPTAEPFIVKIDLDDYFVDPMARTWHEVGFEGHRFLADVEDCIASGLFPGKEEMLRKLPQAGKDQQRHDSEGTDSERSEMLTRTWWDTRDQARKKVWLQQVTIYQGEQPVEVTLPMTEVPEDGDYLLVRPYYGPPGGRYMKIALRPVPNNLFGPPLCGIIDDLAESADSLARRILTQLRRAKQIIAHTREATDDVQQLNASKDGATVPVDNVNALKQLTYGGVQDGAMEGLAFLIQEWNNSTGSVQQLGGSGQLSGSGTATEAEILQGNANARLGKLQRRVRRLRTEISSKLAWSLLDDPLLQMPVAVRIPGGETIDQTLDANSLKGDYVDFNFDVEVDVAGSNDPVTMVRRFNEFIQGLSNAFPLMQAGVLNPMNMARIFGSMISMPELDQMINDPMFAMMTEMALQGTEILRPNGNTNPVAAAAQPGQGPQSRMQDRRSSSPRQGKGKPPP